MNFDRGDTVPTSTTPVPINSLNSALVMGRWLSRWPPAQPDQLRTWSIACQRSCSGIFCIGCQRRW